MKPAPQSVDLEAFLAGRCACPERHAGGFTCPAPGGVMISTPGGVVPMCIPCSVALEDGRLSAALRY